MDETSSGVRQIIGDALDKIRERAEKLERVNQQTGSELAEANAIVKAIEKALGGKRIVSPRSPTPAHPRDGVGNTPRPAHNPRAVFTRKVIELLADGNGRTPDGIAHHFGSSVAYVQTVLTQAVSRGELVTRDGAYHVPS